MSSDIVAFIEARLADDEATLRNLDSTALNGIESTTAGPVRGYVERGLRDVEAKRRLLFQFKHRRAATLAMVQPSTGGVWDDLLHMLAEPWSDQLDYQAEWTP